MVGSAASAVFRTQAVALGRRHRGRRALLPSPVDVLGDGPGLELIKELLPLEGRTQGGWSWTKKTTGQWYLSKSEWWERSELRWSVHTRTEAKKRHTTALCDLSEFEILTHLPNRHVQTRARVIITYIHTSVIDRQRTVCTQR